jgi:hypothetical protein
MWPLFGLAADLDVKPPEPKPAPPAANIFAPPDVTCVEWTDGCRVCRKPVTGETACSNVGPACTPQPARCTQR